MIYCQYFGPNCTFMLMWHTGTKEFPQSIYYCDIKNNTFGN